MVSRQLPGIHIISEYNAQIAGVKRGLERLISAGKIMMEQSKSIMDDSNASVCSAALTDIIRLLRDMDPRYNVADPAIN